MTDHEAADRLAELGIERLWVSYHSYAGLAQTKAVGRDRLPDALSAGVAFAMANWDFTINDHQVPRAGFAADSGDFRVVPDPATIRPLPHRPGVALAYGWLTEGDGAPWPGDPRARLVAAETALRERGVRVKCGIEAEWAFFRKGSDGTPEPDDHGLMFTQAALDARWPLLEAILDGLEAMAIPVHQIAKEYGAGQYELSLLPSTPLEAVDKYLAARDLIKALAHQHGIMASFMPKPGTDLAGNGLHVHASLQDDAGRELLPDLADPDALSATGLAAVAGLVDHAAGQAAIGSATPNSFKRLLPGSWAPAHACWGFGNRAALVRIPGSGPGRHLEYRAGDASANVYLHLTGLLAAIDDGLARDVSPPEPISTDIGHLTDAEAATLDAPRLPARLDAALDALDSDAVLQAALGPVIVPHYLALKRFEWASYLAESGLAPDDVTVSDWERATYLEAV